jgi:hypothetical protein
LFNACDRAQQICFRTRHRGVTEQRRERTAKFNSADEQYHCTDFPLTCNVSAPLLSHCGGALQSARMADQNFVGASISDSAVRSPENG